MAARHTLFELEVPDLARQVERYDRVAHGVKIHKDKQARRQPRQEAHNEPGPRAGVADLERSRRLEPLVVAAYLSNSARREEENGAAGESQAHPSPLRHQPGATR